MTDVRESPLSGVQHGVAFAAFNRDGTERTVTLRDSKLVGYQKNGFVGTGESLTARVLGSNVTGAGTTSEIGQNGIQISGSAVGEIRNNTVTGHDYTGEPPVGTANVILYGYSTDEQTVVAGNEFANGEIGVAVASSLSVIRAPSNDPTRDDDTDEETVPDDTIGDNETVSDNETVDGNDTDPDDTEIDAEPDTVEEATVENSTAEFDEADLVDEVAFETETVNTSVEVEEYDDPPETVTEEVTDAVTATDAGDDDDGDTGDDVEADVVSVVDISPTDEEAENASATVELTVNTAELNDPEDVVVTHETADGWEELNTTVRNVSDGEVTLAAETDSFSLFAVVEVETDTETTEPTTTTTAATDETTAADDTTAADSSTDDSTDGSSDGGGLPGFTATAAIIALAGALVALRRRTE